MRVVGGQLRGRRLQAVPAAGANPSLRPTADRVRESIFNLLAHGGYSTPPPPDGMRVLDLFAGSGALGIEALSRGAQHCVFVESDSAARVLILRNLEGLGLTGRARVFRRDATRLGQSSGRTFDLLFLDPPYANPTAGVAALHSAHHGGWARPHALAVVECADAVDLPTVPSWSLVDRRSYGTAGVTLLRHSG